MSNDYVLEVLKIDLFLLFLKSLPALQGDMRYNIDHKIYHNINQIKSDMLLLHAV